MSQQNTFTENYDSDRSISEEETLDAHWSENCVSLGSSREKGKIEVLSQFEMLRDARPSATKAAILSEKRQTGFFVEEEVDIPIFDNGQDDFCYPRRASTLYLDEEIISDDENTRFPNFGSVKKDGAAETWFAAAREAEALLHLNENAECSSSYVISSKSNRSCGRGKAKAKFSFRFQSHNEDLSWFVNGKDETSMSSVVLPLPKELKPVEQKHMENSMAERLEVFQGDKMQSQNHVVPAEGAVGRDHTAHSMAELLGCFQEKNGLLQGNCKTVQYSGTKGRREKLLVKRSISLLGDRNMDYHDLPEALDSGPSTDDEDNPQNLKLIISESKRKSMADQFQEALGASSVDNERQHVALPRQSGIGLFGKLQQVMRREKERDVDFLKSLQKEACSHEEARCIDVRILSSCLEAKLTVCCCSFSGDEEGSEWVDNPRREKEVGGRTLTIVFGSRICSDVELEVGNLIRVHPPWKEVHVTGRNETIILSTYFSQIST